MPRGFQIETILVVSRGINMAMRAWGDALLTRYGKSRQAAWEKDVTLQYLGYSTDRGGYYYYNPGAATGSRTTLLRRSAADRSPFESLRG